MTPPCDSPPTRRVIGHPLTPPTPEPSLRSVPPEKYLACPCFGQFTFTAECQ